MAPTCSLDGCSAPASDGGKSRFSSSCGVCNRKLCIQHHPCEHLAKEERRVARKFAKYASWTPVIRDIAMTPIKQDALALNAKASTCTVKLPQLSDVEDVYKHMMVGAYHINILVTFDTGERWLARFRQGVTHGSDPNGERRRGRRDSELENLKVLHEVAPSFIAAVWKPERTARHEICPDYFFVEYIDGEYAQVSHLYSKYALCDGGWNRATMRDLAALAVQASLVSFTGIGSLVPSGPDEPSLLRRVGPLHVPHVAKELQRGPFRTIAEMLYAQIDSSLEHFGKGTSIKKVKKNLDQILESLDVRHLISMCPALAEEGPTYLKHADLKETCFRLRPDGSLAGIIDWEFAYTVPLAQAFTWDDMLCDRTPNLTPLQIVYQEELVALGRPDIAATVPDTYKHIMLEKAVETLYDRKGPLTPKKRWDLRKAWLGEAAGDEPTTLEEANAEVWVRHGDHPLLRLLASEPAEDAESDEKNSDLTVTTPATPESPPQADSQ